MGAREPSVRREIPAGETPSLLLDLAGPSTLSDLVEAASMSPLVGQMLVDLGALLGDLGQILRQGNATPNVYLSLLGDLGKQIDEVAKRIGKADGLSGPKKKEAGDYVKAIKEEIGKGDKANLDALARALKALHAVIKEKLGAESVEVVRDGLLLVILLWSKTQVGGTKTVVSYEAGPPAKVCFAVGPSAGGRVCAKVKPDKKDDAKRAAEKINKKLVKCEPPSDDDAKGIADVLDEVPDSGKF